MSTQLPLNISMGALPPNQAWTPQELADAIAARLAITTQATLALFVAGSTAPSSDSGPWWKDNATWYRWDAGSGTYVPQTIEPASLGYSVGETAPDPALYTFWIQTSASLQPLALKTWYSGAWTDVYASDLAGYLTIAAFNTAIAAYSTTAQMNAAIAAAVAGVVVNAGKNVFRAIPSANQDIVHGGAGSLTTDVNFGTEVFDPDGSFAANIFTAPADGYYSFQSTLQLSVSAGAPTDVDFSGEIVSSSGPTIPMSGRDDTGTGQSFSAGSGTLYLLTGNTVKVQAVSNADAACTVRVNSGGSFFSGCRIR